MAKTMNQNPSSTDQANGTQKQRKKQAKLEAKAMLAVEQAKASVEKAQRKFAKAQQRLESRIARLHTRENKLSELRSSSFESEGSAPQPGMNGQSEQSTAPVSEQETATVPPGSQPNAMSEEDEATSGASEAASSGDTSIPTDQEVSEPPAEGRADIFPEDQATYEQESPQDDSSHEDTSPGDQATSEQGSSQDEPSHEEAY